MAITVDSVSQLDQTVRIFDSFYNNLLNVSFADYDMVYSYFSSVCGSDQVAQNYTYLFFLIAQNTGIPVFTLLAEVSKGKNAQGTTGLLQMNSIVCYYLNGFKAKTSLYGVSVPLQANQPAARNVVL
jgi:hypothetical protein